MGSFRDLLVWQRAFALCIRIYGETDRFPADERYGLTAELRKTARSVVYNIAEGHRRSSFKDFARFLDISRGSGGELMTQLLIAETLRYLPPPTAQALLAQLDEVNRMLVGLQANLRSRTR